MKPVIGSLCSGYGGLDMALSAATGGRVAWHVEYDKHPSAILAHRFPGVPNHGDVKLTDWHAVEPIDWLTAGYPCQPFSHAGLRKGADDPRHLWPGVARAISVLRPRGVLLENVRGHVSLGLDAVLGDLAGLGYDARWGVVRASDAGAPHGRARIFIVATDARGERHGGGEDARGLGCLDGAHEGRSRQRERAWPEPVDRDSAAAADSDDGGSRARRTGQDGRLEPVHVVRDEPAADAAGIGRGEGRAESAGVEGRPDAAQRRLSVASDTDGAGRGRVEEQHTPAASGIDGEHRGHADGRGDGTDWGAYTGAVSRWERIVGRRAPRPTEPGARTGERLSPVFVEWMMGLPEGHVTDVPGLPRNAQLKALGNGVVPQQAILAYRLLAPAANAEALSA